MTFKTTNTPRAPHILMDGIALFVLAASLGCDQTAFVGQMEPVEETGGTGGQTLVGGAGGISSTTGTGGTAGFNGTGGTTQFPTSVANACGPITTAPGVLNPCGRTPGIAYSPDGQLLAAGMQDVKSSIHIYRLSDGMSLFDSTGTETETTYDVEFSPDGKMLATAGYQGNRVSLDVDGGLVRLWDVTTGAILRTLPVKTGGYTDTVAFAHDGTLLATGGYKGKVEIWRIVDGTLVRSIDVPTSVHNVHFSPDDSLLSVATVDGKARIWNVNTGALALTVETTAEMADADFSPDGRQIASTGDGNVIKIWDAATGNLLQTMSGHSAYISHVVWIDQNRLLSDDWSGVVKLWTRDASGNLALENTWSNGDQALGMAVAPDKTSFVVAGGSGFRFLSLTAASTRVIEVAAGWYHTCALMADTTVRCWGFNYGGMIGNGTSGDWVPNPTPVTGLSNAIHIAADYTDSCAQLKDGSLRCWGLSSYGQLGDGTTSEQDTPVAILGGQAIAQVSLGEYHSCALLLDGTVDCYGSGELGNGTEQSNPNPTPVPGLSGVQQISAGDTQTCALLTDGTVSCQGQNPTTGHYTFSPIPGLSHVMKVAVGGNTVCALLDDGTAKCWGANNYGAVGDGTLVNRSEPTPVAGLSNATDLAAGSYHMCALLADKTVKCWGNNTHGELGDGTKTNRTTPVQVSGLTNIVQISLGVTHTCAVDINGTLLCCGDEYAYVKTDVPNSPNINRVKPTRVTF